MDAEVERMGTGHTASAKGAKSDGQETLSRRGVLKEGETTYQIGGHGHVHHD